MHAFTPLHIVVVSDHASVTGGIAKVALESAVGLARRGHEVTFFAAAGPVWPGLAEAGVRVVCLEQHDHLNDPNRLRSAVRGLWNTAAAGTLRAVLAPLDPARTVVHVHGWSKGLSPSVGSVVAASGLPTVYTLHEYFLACPNGAFFDFQESRNCPLRPMSLPCVARNCDARNYGHKAWRVARHAILQRTRNFTTATRHFIYLSDLQIEVMRPHLPAEATFHKVPNPIAVERHSRAEVGAQSTFLFVGRLSREKGAALFAEAARELGLRVRFVGDGPERERIASILPEAEMSGWLSSDKVVEAMGSARALAFPSIWYEGQPIVVHEARARGVPVVVSDNTAAREQIVDGETGLLFRSGDKEALKAALLRLDAGTADRLGRAAYDSYWADPPTLEKHIDALEAVYAKVGGFPALSENPQLREMAA